MNKRETVFCAVMIVLMLVGSCFRAPGCARAAEKQAVDGQEQIYKPGLEEVAQTFWGRRDVTLPGPVEQFTMPFLSFGETHEGILGEGEQPGTRVWLIAQLFRQREAYARCVIYLHERGHNAGLEHTLEGVMSAVYTPKIRIPLCLTYAHVGGRVG